MKTLFHLSSLAIFKYNRKVHYIPPDIGYLQFINTVLKENLEIHPIIQCPAGYPLYDIKSCCVQSELFERIIECDGFESIGKAIWFAKIISNVAARYNHLNCCFVFNIKTLKIATLHGHLDFIEKFVTNTYGNTCSNERKLAIVRKYYTSMSICKYLFPTYLEPTTSDLEKAITKNLYCAIYLSKFVKWTSFCGSFLALRRRFNDLLVIIEHGYNEFNPFLFQQVAQHCYCESSVKILLCFPKEIVNDCEYTLITDLARKILNLSFPMYRFVLSIESIFNMFMDCNYDAFVETLPKLSYIPNCALSIMITSEFFNIKTLRYFIRWCIMNQKNLMGSKILTYILYNRGDFKALNLVGKYIGFHHAINKNVI